MAEADSLNRALRELLARHRTAALGTIDESGAVFVSMVPFAVDPQDRSLVIHVSDLAAHTRNLLSSPRVSMLVCQAEASGEPVHALPRVTLDAQATTIEPGGTDALACRAVYLSRFPEAEAMTSLGDFRFFRLRLRGARQVAGFGAARSLDATEMALALGPSP